MCGVQGGGVKNDPKDLLSTEMGKTAVGVGLACEIQSLVLDALILRISPDTQVGIYSKRLGIWP